MPLTELERTVVEWRKKVICSVHDCGGRVLAHNLCGKHYLRRRRHGSEHIVKPAVKPPRIILCTVNGAECWNWAGAHCGGGYGIATVNGKKIKIPKIMLEAKLGRSIYKGMLVLHICDNKRCVNPEHLYEGTASQNIIDAYARNRRGNKKSYVA